MKLTTVSGMKRLADAWHLLLAPCHQPWLLSLLQAYSSMESFFFFWGREGNHLTPFLSIQSPLSWLWQTKLLCLCERLYWQLVLCTSALLSRRGPSLIWLDWMWKQTSFIFLSHSPLFLCELAPGVIMFGISFNKAKCFLLNTDELQRLLCDIIALKLLKDIKWQIFLLQGERAQSS